MSMTEAQKRASAKWNREHTKKVSCALNLEQYEAFRSYAERHGKTVSGMVKQLVMDCIPEMKRPPIDSADRIRHCRGFKIGEQSFPTLPELQEHLRSVGVDVSDNVILNWISKGRLSRANMEQFPILEQITTYEYIV